MPKAAAQTARRGAHAESAFTDPKVHSTFNTIAAYWYAMNAFPEPSKSIVDVNVFLFSAGVDPTWEHPANTKGGRWTLSVDKSEPVKADKAWLELHMALVGEMLDTGGPRTKFHVTGIAYTKRRDYTRISVWVADRENDEEVNLIGRRIQHLTGVDLVEFQDHGAPHGVCRHRLGAAPEGPPVDFIALRRIERASSATASPARSSASPSATPSADVSRSPDSRGETRKKNPRRESDSGWSIPGRR